MNARHEELLMRYFDGAMAPGEEQQFLITLAASDELRIAFRSQLELMKAIKSDKDLMPSAGLARARTFAALGLSTAAVGTYFEHDLLAKANAAPAQVPSASINALTSASASAPTSWLGRLFAHKIASLGSGLLIGALATFGITEISKDTAPKSSAATVATQPVATQPVATQPVATQPALTTPMEPGSVGSGNSMPAASNEVVKSTPEANRAVASSTAGRSSDNSPRNSLGNSSRTETKAGGASLATEHESRTEPTLPAMRRQPSSITVKPNIAKPSDSLK